MPAVWPCEAGHTPAGRIFISSLSANKCTVVGLFYTLVLPGDGVSPHSPLLIRLCNIRALRVGRATFMERTPQGFGSLAPKYCCVSTTIYLAVVVLTRSTRASSVSTDAMRAIIVVAVGFLRNDGIEAHPHAAVL